MVIVKIRIIIVVIVLAIQVAAFLSTNSSRSSHRLGGTSAATDGTLQVIKLGQEVTICQYTYLSYSLTYEYLSTSKVPSFVPKPLRGSLFATTFPESTRSGVSMAGHALGG